MVRFFVNLNCSDIVIVFIVSKIRFFRSSDNISPAYNALVIPIGLVLGDTTLNSLIDRPKYSDYLPITEYCSITFPSRYPDNPRRPLLRVIPLIYKWDRLSEINMCGDGYKDFTRFSIVVSRSPFGSRFHRPNVCGGKICVWIPPDVIYIKDYPFFRQQHPYRNTTRYPIRFFHFHMLDYPKGEIYVTPACACTTSTIEYRFSLAKKIRNGILIENPSTISDYFLSHILNPLLTIFVIKPFEDGIVVEFHFLRGAVNHIAEDLDSYTILLLEQVVLALVKDESGSTSRDKFSRSILECFFC